MTVTRARLRAAILNASRGPALALVAALTLAVALTLHPVALDAQQSATPVVGPERGTLVIVGGAMQSPEIYKRFIDLAGGPDAPLVMVPTAGGAEEYDQFYQGLTAWRDAGARNLTVLHTTDPRVADTDAFIQPLNTAAGVFFFGGRQWRLVDAYGGTKAEAAFRAVLDRGGVIGGSSAGASIQGSFMVRGDTATNTVMMGSHQRGFGYMRNVGIDQHVLRRNRHFDLIEVIEAHPHLLGIGVDENTALVVQGDEGEVIGASHVLVYDNRSIVGNGGKFYFLAPGDRLNLATREAVRPGRTDRPVEGVRREPWGGG